MAGAAGAAGPAGPAGPTGPQGVVGVQSLGPVAWNFITQPGVMFLGTPVNVTTTATQKVIATATTTATMGNSQVSMVWFGWCSRPQGSSSAPVPLTGSASPDLFVQWTSTVATFTAAETKVPGAGMWEIGLCAENSSINPSTNTGTGVALGWVMVTN